MKPEVRRWLERTLLVAGVALAVYVISRFPLSQIADACLQLGWAVLIPPVLCLLWFAAAARALYHLLDGNVPWGVLMWNRLVGEGYNTLLPAAGLGGEPVKLAQISRYVSMERAVVALINDRLIENAIGLVYSAAVIAAAAFVLDVSAALRTSMLTYGGAAGAVGLAMAAVIFTNLTGRAGDRIARWLGASTIGGTRLPVAVVARAFWWSAIGRALGFAEVAVLFAVLGLPVTAWTVTFTTAALAAAGFVGGVIPQQAGIAEAATVGVFDLLHFPGPAAIAFALARRGRMLFVSALGVALHVAFGRRVAHPDQ